MPSGESHFNLFNYFLGEERLSQIGNRTAIEFCDKRFTYPELHDYVVYWAKQISDLGATKGTRVALLLYDSPELIACFLGAVSIGAVCVPINTFLSSEEIAFILADSGAGVIVVESELQKKVPSIEKLKLLAVETSNRLISNGTSKTTEDLQVAATTRNTPAFILYTSGSTGAPKGVLHVHGSIPHTVENYSVNVLNLTVEDRIYSSSRMFFAYGLGNSVSFPLAAGATVLVDTQRSTAEHLANLIAERKPTVFFGVPAVYLSLLEYRAKGNPLDFSGVRICVSAGEGLPQRIFEDWRREFGLTIYDGIGSTEMLHIFISNSEKRVRAGSTGTVIPGYEARLVDDAGDETAPGQPGNLWVRGESATAGYWNRPDLTEHTVKDGWVRTGDVYRRDEEGFFFHIGRSDDCFKVRGLWVSPVEVESVLVSHPSISEAAVVSSIDELGLATARAYVVIRQGERGDALKEEIRQFAGSRLPHYKVPTQIEFLNEMPRTSTGKVQRYKLRAEAGRALLGGSDEQIENH
jgi:benzoate-CoA ligase family protein